MSIETGTRSDKERRELGRVLLVDDDAALARSFSRVLIQAGFHVDTASDGSVAVEILRGNDYDVVLSDISMPGMSGIDLLRAVREVDLDLPVLLMTGSPDTETAVRAVEFGALRYLIKPIALTTLLADVGFGVQMYRMARLKREALQIVGDVRKFVGDRAGLESRFGHALEGLGMAYQPIVCWSKKEVFAYEALVRTREPSLASPGALFDAAERLDGLHPLGRTIRAAVARRAAEEPRTILFVNLHAHDLVDEELFSPRSPLSGVAHRVVLEITERASLDAVGGVRARIDKLRRLGFRIAVDDLGAGYAGLTSFAQVQPDVVKLDMSLTRDLDQDPTKERVVGAMLALCRQLGMQVVAEGVETAGERDKLVALGCDLLQGYLFARPAPELVTLSW
jgi:EAL domain-containing protein (putative c-di-GMP-specific phosphodiesterase class I)/ActR/RegA family two-component response regulator